MDKLCNKCRALASTDPPITYLHHLRPLFKLPSTDNENVYNKILLNQKEDYQQCVKVLLEVGAHGNAELYEDTTLVQAARLGHVKRLQALISAGADVNQLYREGDFYPIENALTRSVSEGHIECVEILIKAGADVNMVGNQEISVLR